MISSKRRSIPAMMAGALSLTSVAAFGQQSQPTQQELLDTVRSLQTKVAQLEAKTQEATVAASNAEKAIADRTVAEVLADADKRSQLIAEGGPNAGWIKSKFVIQSDDGKFTFAPAFVVQFRGVANFIDESPATGDDNFESGWEIRRAKFGFAGKLGSDIGYRFQWTTSQSGGAVTLDDAEITYKISDTLTFYGGQFKDPVHHEELTSD